MRSLQEVHKMDAYRVDHACLHDLSQEPLDRFELNLLWTLLN